jgi:hypothetical protein
MEPEFIEIFESLTPKEQKMIVNICLELVLKNEEIKVLTKYIKNNLKEVDK